MAFFFQILLLYFMKLSGNGILLVSCYHNVWKKSNICRAAAHYFFGFFMLLSHIHIYA